MKRLILSYLFLAIGLMAFSSELSPQQVKDSLLQMLNTQPHDSTRLMTLHALARLDQTSPSFIEYEDQLLKEAVKQKNIKYQCIAMHNHIIYYFNHNNKEEVQEWMHRLSEIAPKNGYYDLYFDAKRWMIELHFLREEVELGIHEAKKMEAEAIQQKNIHGQMVANLCLLSGYLGTLQFERGIEAADKAYALLSPQDDALTKINVLTRTVATYSFVKNDEKMIIALNELEQAFNEINPALQSAYINVKLSIEANYVIYYLHKNQLGQARKHLEEMDKYYNPNFYLSVKVERLNAYAEFYKYNKEFDKALAIRDSIIAQVRDLYPNEVTMQNIKKADILIDAGRMSEALPLYQKGIILSDSINLAVLHKQMEQIQDIYNVDKLLLEKEELKARIQITALSVIGIVLILSIGFTMRSYQTRRRLKQAERETREATRITEETNEVKSRFLSNMSYNIRIPLNNVVGFSQLIATDPNIDEEMLADYSKIIQKNAGELIQLVNDVLDLSRLEAKMMRFNSTDYGIIDICNDAIGQVRMKENRIQVIFMTDLHNSFIHTDISRFNQVLLSLLMYPEPCEQPRRIVFKLEEADNMFVIKIHNTPLADPAFSTQTVAVRHEINRLIVEHFGGKYEVKTKLVEGPTVIFTIPTAETSKMTE